MFVQKWKSTCKPKQSATGLSTLGSQPCYLNMLTAGLYTPGKTFSHKYVHIWKQPVNPNSQLQVFHTLKFEAGGFSVQCNCLSVADQQFWYPGS